MRKYLFLTAVLGLTITAWCAVRAADAPKYTIKQVMAKAMKGGLCKKVADGKASDDEKKELVAMFEALAAATPPKGEAESWKEKTGALLTAANGNDGAALKKASNCMGCHSAHKGK